MQGLQARMSGGSRRAATRQAEGCQGLLLGLWRAEAVPRQAINRGVEGARLHPGAN